MNDKHEPSWMKILFDNPTLSSADLEKHKMKIQTASKKKRRSKILGRLKELLLSLLHQGQP